jgi:hypothetical protein
MKRNKGDRQFNSDVFCVVREERGKSSTLNFWALKSEPIISRPIRNKRIPIDYTTVSGNITERHKERRDEKYHLF